jgi:hypothetical protein
MGDIARLLDVGIVQKCPRAPARELDSLQVNLRRQPIEQRNQDIDFLVAEAVQ